jgi:hypothetical protein
VHLSKECGWYDAGNGDVYVTANKRYADDDPAVKALPGIFEKISDDTPPGPVKTAVAKAKAAATGKGQDGG